MFADALGRFVDHDLVGERARATRHELALLGERARTRLQLATKAAAMEATGYRSSVRRRDPGKPDNVTLLAWVRRMPRSASGCRHRPPLLISGDGRRSGSTCRW